MVVVVSAPFDIPSIVTCLSLSFLTGSTRFVASPAVVGLFSSGLLSTFVKVVSVDGPPTWFPFLLTGMLAVHNTSPSLSTARIFVTPAVPDGLLDGKLKSSGFISTLL